MRDIYTRDMANNERINFYAEPELPEQESEQKRKQRKESAEQEQKSEQEQHTGQQEVKN